MDPKAVNMILEKVTEQFGKLTTRRGTEHIFLGIKLKIKDKKMQVDMGDQLREGIKTFGEKLENNNVVSPAAKK